MDDGGWLKKHQFLQASSKLRMRETFIPMAAQACRARPAAVVAEAVEGPPGGMAEVAVHAHFGHQAGHLGAPLRSPTSPAQVVPTPLEKRVKFSVCLVLDMTGTHLVFVLLTLYLRVFI